jgi:hypothetical protein
MVHLMDKEGKKRNGGHQRKKSESLSDFQDGLGIQQQDLDGHTRLQSTIGGPAANPGPLYTAAGSGFRDTPRNPGMSSSDVRDNDSTPLLEHIMKIPRLFVYSYSAKSTDKPEAHSDQQQSQAQANTTGGPTSPHRSNLSLKRPSTSAELGCTERFTSRQKLGDVTANTGGKTREVQHAPWDFVDTDNLAIVHDDQDTATPHISPRKTKNQTDTKSRCNNDGGRKWDNINRSRYGDA